MGYGEMSGRSRHKRCRAMPCARTPSMQGGRCTTASHQSRGHSVTVPRDGASPRSAVPSKIRHRSASFLIATRPLGTIRRVAAAEPGVELPLRVGYPTPELPPAGVPCGPRLGLLTQVTGRNELEPWVRWCKKPANPRSLPRARLANGGRPGPDYAGALATLSEVVKTAWPCRFSSIGSCDQSQRSRHLTQTWPTRPTTAEGPSSAPVGIPAIATPRASGCDHASVLAHRHAVSTARS